MSDYAKTVVRVLTTFASFSVGLGALAFSTGYLALKAQSRVVNLPVIFVDYWAYAEAGFTALSDSVAILLGHWWLPALMFAVSIACILLLESDKFRAWLTCPHWLFLASIFVLTLTMIMVNQQLEIRRIDTPNKLDVRWPFTLVVPPKLADPAGLPAIPEDAESGYRQLATEIELRSELNAKLALRPAPGWMPPPNSETENPILWSVSVEGASNETRATALYEAMVCYIAVLLWGFGGIALWAMFIVRRGNRPPSREDGLLVRLREELWHACRFVVVPINGVLLAIVLVLIMPACYGALQLDKLGGDLVEVASHSKKEDPTSDAESDGGHGSKEALSPEEIDRIHVELHDSAQSYPFSDRTTKDSTLNSWTVQIAMLEQDASFGALEAIRKLRSFTRFMVPELSLVAANALARIEITQTGFVLYYPRRENDPYLHLIVEDRENDSARWRLNPIRIREIAEVRIRTEGASKQIVRLLKSMRSTSEFDRLESIESMMEIGHPSLLEIVLVAAHDPHPTVRGPMITAAGRYATALPDSPWNKLRRQRAIDVLMRIVENGNERPDLRGAAITSVGYIAEGGDRAGPVAKSLHDVLKTYDDTDRHDWNVVGGLISQLGRLRYSEALTDLEAILTDENVPESTKSVVPTALQNIRDGARTMRFIEARLDARDVSDDLQLRLAAVYGELAKRGNEDATQLLWEFVNRETVDREQVATIIQLIGEIGARNGVPMLIEVIENSEKFSSEARTAAAIQLKQLSALRAEPALLRIAEDSEDKLKVRYFAILALGETSDPIVTEHLFTLWTETEDPNIKKAIYQALKNRASQGSGRAANYIDQIKELQRRLIEELLERQRESNGDTPPADDAPGEGEGQELGSASGPETAGYEIDSGPRMRSVGFGGLG